MAEMLNRALQSNLFLALWSVILVGILQRDSLLLAATRSLASLAYTLAELLILIVLVFAVYKLTAKVFYKFVGV